MTTGGAAVVLDCVVGVAVVMEVIDAVLADAVVVSVVVDGATMPVVDIFGLAVVV